MEDRQAGDPRPDVSKTRVDIDIRPIRNRDRRRRELKLCIDQMVTSLRSYLMGEVVHVRHVE